jgi:hypothetical protein
MAPENKEIHQYSATGQRPVTAINSCSTLQLLLITTGIKPVHQLLPMLRANSHEPVFRVDFQKRRRFLKILDFLTHMDNENWSIFQKRRRFCQCWFTNRRHQKAAPCRLADDFYFQKTSTFFSEH